MPLNLPEKSYKDDDDTVLKRRLLGAAVLIALAVIILPLVLDGSGSESRFRRVEQLRQEPPRVVDAGVQVTIPDKDKIPKPKKPPAVAVNTQAVTQPEPEAVAEAAILKPKTDSEEAVANTPEQPGVAATTTETLVVDNPVADNPVADKPVVDKLKETTPAVVKVEAKPVSDKVIDSVAWVIQAGSYADETNALTLRDRLRVAGFPAFSSAAQSSGTNVYRVKVGPINNRLEAQTVQKQVESLIEQSTLIKKYP